MPTTGVSAGSTMPREAHRPYRFGMTLLCFGGLLNWVGLFENYTEPVRYIGVTCVVSGAILLCFAICCWLRPGAHRENAWGQAHQHANPAMQRDPVHFITLDRSTGSSSGQTVTAQKPPDYDSVTDKPPSYDDAIKLSPALLWLANEHERHEGELLSAGANGANPGGDDALAAAPAYPKDITGQELTVCEVDDGAAGSPLPPRLPPHSRPQSRGSRGTPRGSQSWPSDDEHGPGPSGTSSTSSIESMPPGAVSRPSEVAAGLTSVSTSVTSTPGTGTGRL